MIRDLNGTEIAVIGMAARLPGAGSTDAFWSALEDGRDLVTDFGADELDAAVTRELRSVTDYVRCAAVLDGIDMFDAGFFGISAAEAALTDPQQRLLLETCWRAVEDAGHAGEEAGDRIGVFAAVSPNTYLLNNLVPTARAPLGQGHDLSLLIGNDKDFAASRVAYRLGFTGPAMVAQTACSSGLTALHLACRSLQAYDCDIAVVAASSVRVPHRAGYLYQDGGIFSRTGRCRAFDADADGCVPGSGAVAIVLRRLADAEAGGDHLHATVLSTAVNNDGNRKVGLAAPSIAGQVEVISTAHALAEIDASQVGYLEAHGTGTRLGDSIEAAALARVFGDGGPPLGIGSVKTNLGHLDAAAGLVGFLKVVLSLRRRLLPPSLHFRTLNPDIVPSGINLFVVSEPTPWLSAGPRIAGVSSFGVGGTNVHAVLVEARRPAERPHWAAQIALPVSSAQVGDLPTDLCRLAAHLRDRPSVRLADVAYTLRAGRRHFPHRAVVIARTPDRAVALLEAAARSSGNAVLADPDAAEDLVESWRRWSVGGPLPPPVDLGPSPRRTALPGATMHPARHWADPPGPPPAASWGTASARDLRPADDTIRLYETVWDRRPNAFGAGTPPTPMQRWLLLHGGEIGGAAMATAMRRRFGSVVELVAAGHTLARLAAQAGRIIDSEGVDRVVVLAGNTMRAGHDSLSRAAFHYGRPLAFDAPLAVAKALSTTRRREPVHIDLVTAGRFRVVGDEPVDIAQSLVEGAYRVLPDEVPGASTRCWDLPFGALIEPGESLLTAMAAELGPAGPGSFAVRGGAVWRRRLEVAMTPDPVAPYADPGPVLITGPFGGIGSYLATELAQASTGIQLGLLARRPTPTRITDDWAVAIAELRQRGRDLLDAAAVDLLYDTPGLVDALERLCAARITDYWRTLGVPTHSGSGFTEAELARRAQVRPSLQRMLTFQVDVLRRDGYLEDRAETLQWVRDAPAPEAGDEYARLVRDLDPRLSRMVDMLEHCVHQYPYALSGAVESISVLYPKGQADLMAPAAESMISRSTGETCCQLLADYVARCATGAAGGPLRVLEVGAGNGLLTRRLLQALGERRTGVALTVTDIGRAFVDGAAARHGAGNGADVGPAVSYRILDITADLPAQGFEVDSFDLIVGLNVVHATPDVIATLANLTTLLAPGGTIGLVESVRAERWVDMVAGLAEGWWAFTDHRRLSPLLSTASWSGAFEAAGLSDFADLPGEDVIDANRLDCAVLMARRPREPVPSEVDPRENALLQRLAGLDADVAVARADLRDAGEVTVAIDSLGATLGPPVTVVHTAGRIAGALARNLTTAQCDIEFDARILGLLAVLEATRDKPPERLFLTSSLNTVTGGIGQFAYVAANAVLSGIGDAWRHTGRTAHVLHWDRWSATGLGSTFEKRFGHLADDRIDIGLDPRRAAASLGAVAWLGLADTVVTTRNLTDASLVLAPVSRESVTAAPDAASDVCLDARAHALLLEALLGICRRVLKLPRVDATRPLLEAGADSLDIIELQAVIQEELGVKVFSASLMTESVTRIASACADPAAASATLELTAPAKLHAVMVGGQP